MTENSKLIGGTVGRPEGGKLINDVQLMQMLPEHSIQYCADFFGVTVGAIKFAVKRIKKSLKGSPPSDGDLNADNIDSLKQLKEINHKIISQLARCDKLIDREEIKTEALNQLQERVTANPHDLEAQETMDKIWGNNLKAVLAIQSNIISMSGEVRKQIELQIKIAETLFNLQMISEFQNEMIGLLKEVDPFTAQKFITKLKERRQIRGLIKLNP